MDSNRPVSSFQRVRTIITSIKNFKGIIFHQSHHDQYKSIWHGDAAYFEERKNLWNITLLRTFYYQKKKLWLWIIRKKLFNMVFFIWSYFARWANHLKRNTRRNRFIIYHLWKIQKRTLETVWKEYFFSSLIQIKHRAAKVYTAPHKSRA